MHIIQRSKKYCSTAGYWSFHAHFKDMSYAHYRRPYCDWNV